MTPAAQRAAEIVRESLLTRDGELEARLVEALDAHAREAVEAERAEALRVANAVAIELAERWSRTRANRHVWHQGIGAEAVVGALRDRGAP